MKGYWEKFLTIAALSLGSMLLLSLVEDVTDERKWRQFAVKKEIATQHGGHQKLTAPLLVLNYTVEYVTKNKIFDEKKSIWKVDEIRNRAAHYMHISAKRTQMDGTLYSKKLNRGIYSVPAYSADIRLSGTFSDIHPPYVGEERNGGKVVKVDEPVLLLPIGVPKGITARPVLQVNDVKKDVWPSHSRQTLTKFPQGIAVDIAPGELKNGSLAFSTKLVFQGAEDLTFTPHGGEFLVSLNSPWPHPKFYGDYLPTDRSVTDGGFTARWFVSDLGGNAGLTPQETFSGEASTFSVSLIEPVNTYTQANRAIAYGFLFTALTLAFFLIFELLQGLKIHIAQYAFVCTALAIFYLLLISLAEHIPFVRAYLMASGACILLLIVYVRSITQKTSMAVIFGIFISILYGILYGILLSEQHALLLGSCLLFSVLASSMFLTRNVDWFALSFSPQKCKTKTPD